MILLPDKYNDIKLSKNEKLLINMIKNKFDDSTVMLLKINPVSKYAINTIIFEDGVCFIENLEIDNLEIMPMLLQGIILSYKQNKTKINNKLLMHRTFNDTSKNVLKFPFSYKYYISELKKEDIDMNKMSPEIQTFLECNCIFKEEVRKLTKNPEELKKLFLNKNEYPIADSRIKLKDEILDILVHILAPEYTIPRYDNSRELIHNSKIIKKEEKEYYVAQGDLSVKVLRLEPEQINIINNVKPGHQLLLACAGSGKSVLLISKCFKTASIHRDKKFLLTCFNRNLNDMYRWRINVAGFRNRNVDCSTFHKLCKDLLDEAGIYYNGRDFDSIFESAKKALAQGKIKRRYYGIYIDEVQVFKSEWYEFCYDLLEKQEEEDYFFVICGDKSQNITKNIKQGKAPWQGNKRLPKYRGRSVRLEKNYRNTIEINDFINKFTEIAKNFSTRINVELKEDEEAILRGQAVRNGDSPQIKVTNRSQEVQEVINTIKNLKEEKGIPLSEIAVLFFNKQYKNEKYYVYYNVKSQLDNNYIEYSELLSVDSMNRCSYGDREGVTLCTIESALGLDFEAVILCGLKPMGAYYKTKKEETFKNNNDEIDECREDYLKNINTLYTGCSRARNNLIVILTEDRDKSIYSKMIIEANNG